jgi:hypothetical protein
MFSVSKFISTQISINFPGYIRLYIGFVWYIIMVLILRTQSVEKYFLEISRFNLSKDFDDVLKMLFGELKMRFMPTAPINIVWYIRFFFGCLKVRKCVFIWNMIYIRVFCFLFQKLSPHKFRSTHLTVVGYM